MRAGFYAGLSSVQLSTYLMYLPEQKSKVDESHAPARQPLFMAGAQPGSLIRPQVGNVRGPSQAPAWLYNYDICIYKLESKVRSGGKRIYRYSIIYSVLYLV